LLNTKFRFVSQSSYSFGEKFSNPDNRFRPVAVFGKNESCVLAVGPFYSSIRLDVSIGHKLAAISTGGPILFISCV